MRGVLSTQIVKFLQIVKYNMAFPDWVEDVEGINSVEVRTEGYVLLSLLELLIKVNLGFEC